MEEIDAENTMEVEEIEQEEVEVEVSFTGILPSPDDEEWKTKTISLSLHPSDTISHVFEKLQKGIEAFPLSLIVE